MLGRLIDCGYTTDPNTAFDTICCVLAHSVQREMHVCESYTLHVLLDTCIRDLKGLKECAEDVKTDWTLIIEEQPGKH